MAEKVDAMYVQKTKKTCPLSELTQGVSAAVLQHIQVLCKTMDVQEPPRDAFSLSEKDLGIDWSL